MGGPESRHALACDAHSHPRDTNEKVVTPMTLDEQKRHGNSTNERDHTGGKNALITIDTYCKKASPEGADRHDCESIVCGRQPAIMFILSQVTSSFIRSQKY